MVLQSTAGAPLVPAIFLYGQSGTGKTTTVLQALANLADLLLPAVINCVETYSSRVLFAEVLHQIDSRLHFRSSEQSRGGLEEEEAEEEKAAPTSRFSINDFVNELQLRVASLAPPRGLCLFFDQAERLRDLQPHLLDALTRLHELCHGRVVTVFASRIAWEKFPCGAFAGVEPMVLHFANYSREQLAAILKASAAAEADAVLQRFPADAGRLLEQFADLLLDVVGPVCRDAGELAFLARGNVRRYLAPLCAPQKALSAADELGLWRSFEPQLKVVMQSVFLRLAQDDAEKMRVELPFFSKFLLLAAYMASYNPKAADKKFLVKNAALAGRMTSRAKHSAKRAERVSRDVALCRNLKNLAQSFQLLNRVIAVDE